MSRLSSLTIAFLFFAGIGTQACRAKPSEEDCRAAANNVRQVSGQGSNDVGADIAAAIRSCQATSSKEAVQCMIAAKTPSDLEKCEGEVAKTNFEQAEKASEDQMKKSEDEKPEEAAPQKETPTAP